jgi:nicotinamidase/pyrazinamidase
MIELAGLPQVLWPVHCVQETRGAEFYPGLDASRVTEVFRKGTEPGIDSYSGFYDNGWRRATGMGDWLKERDVRELFVMGLATDYCVKFTALDGRRLGFEVSLVEEGCRGVELTAGDVVRAVKEMRAAGVRVV